MSVLSTAGYYGAFAYVVYRTVSGELSWGTLQFLAGAISGASSNIQTIFATFSSIADQSLFLTDLVEFFKVQPTVRSKPERHSCTAADSTRDLPSKTYRFLIREVPGESLTISTCKFDPGERIALIGENGQGKTTIVKLITRLYDPTEGRILLDGIDLREYSIEDLNREIGVIFQDFMRYELTALRNISVGRIEDTARDHIELAARKSLADAVIRRLPKGYEQLLGRRFEGGLDLSGGEWQKIALARAYLRDAQLLILDEPTAALDARSEYEVFQRFAELTEGKMALLISHRFSTVRMADRIVVLEDGRIVEQGNHAQLMALGARYAEMFELQAASYR